MFKTFVMTEQTEQTTVSRGIVVKSQSGHCEFFNYSMRYKIQMQIWQCKSNIAPQNQSYCQLVWKKLFKIVL